MSEQTVLPCVDFSEASRIPLPPREPFPLGCFKNKPRPDEYSKEVKQEVLFSLFPKVIEWLENNGESFYDEEDDEEETEELEGVKKQLLDVLQYNEDGFGMAYALRDRHSWEPDDELVDILKSANFYETKQKAVLAWLRDNNVKPKLELGAKVKIKVQPFENNKLCLKDHIGDGIIVQIRDEGEYVVGIPELGHNIERKCGRIIAWEELEKQNA